MTSGKLGKHIKRLGTLSLGLLVPWGVAGQRARTERADLTYPQRTRACTPGTHFTLAAVGDVLLHTNIANTGEAKGYPFLFEAMKPYLERTDFTYGNFEGSVNQSRPLSSFPIFNYSPKLAPALAQAGFDVMSTANNHALDTGPDGVDGSIDSLDAAKILHHGTVKQGKDIPDFLSVPVKAADGTVLNVGFLSYTFGTNNIRDPNDQVNMVWGEDGKVRADVLASIAKARAATDLVIVAVHWGEEYHFLPNGQQQTGARAMVRAGADLVLGDHPHTLEPPAWIQAADHEGLVIYSLGNFVAAQQIFQAKSFTQTTMVFYVGLTKPASGRARVDTYRYLPVHIVGNTRPEPLTAADDALSYQHVLDELRDPKGLAALPVDPAADRRRRATAQRGPVPVVGFVAPSARSRGRRDPDSFRPRRHGGFPVRMFGAPEASRRRCWGQAAVWGQGSAFAVLLGQRPRFTAALRRRRGPAGARIRKKPA